MGVSAVAVGLSAISLLAKFSSRSKKSDPKSQSHFPSPNPVPLAKDAASIPNALGCEKWTAGNEQGRRVCRSDDDKLCVPLRLCEKWAAGNEQGR